MSKAEESWVNARRAESLAQLMLSQRPDLEVIQAPQTSSRARYDFLVRIHKKRISPPPEFAVEAKGMRGGFYQREARALINQTEGSAKTTDVPLCLFVFEVESREGFYRWVLFPDGFPFRDGKGDSVRSFHAALADAPASYELLQEGFRPLNAHAVDEIVNEVVVWYKKRRRVA